MPDRVSIPPLAYDPAGQLVSYSMGSSAEADMAFGKDGGLGSGTGACDGTGCDMKRRKCMSRSQLRTWVEGTLMSCFSFLR